MGHVVLLGDSIFDNARYVPDRPPVIEQVRRGLPQGWQATLLAVDGHTSADVANQLAGSALGRNSPVRARRGQRRFGRKQYLK